MAMSKFSNFAKTMFRKHPLITNSFVYGVLYVGAEFSQQTLTRKVLVIIKQKAIFIFHQIIIFLYIIFHFIFISFAFFFSYIILDWQTSRVWLRNSGTLCSNGHHTLCPNFIYLVLTCLFISSLLFESSHKFHIT